MKLYLVHDDNYCYKVVVKAETSDEAISKVKVFLQRTNQASEFFKSNHVKWIADLCDNDTILE